MVADECSDVIQDRTVYNGEQARTLYRTTASPEAAQTLLVDVLNRVNLLAQRPEFYDTLTNNCTSNIVKHVNRIKPNRIVADYRGDYRAIPISSPTTKASSSGTARLSKQRS